MPRTKKENGNNDHADRQEQIHWMKDNLPEETAIYLLFRSASSGAGNHVVSCYIAKLDGFGVPVIENIDYQVSQILGYKLKENEGVTVMGHADSVGAMLTSSLSFAVFGNYTSYPNKSL